MGKTRGVETTLEEVVRLLEDLFILQGLQAGIRNDDLRAILAIDKRRINRISKLVKDRS